MQTERAAFFSEEPFIAGGQIALAEGDASHVAVLRLGVGERVGLRDGVGNTASGTLVRLGRKNGLIEIDRIQRAAPAPVIHLLVPVADRDRMLWLAEKAAELNVASWRPVLWQRSRSVSPRGDGPTFRAKVRSRMIAAMLQSRSAWLPEIFPEATADRAIAASPAGSRIVLHADGNALGHRPVAVPVIIAVGPEGGFEDDEMEALQGAGFAAAAIGRSVLRFETAAVAGVSVARAMLDGSTTPNDKVDD